MLCGIWIISCGLNLYQTFDYLTLQETLQNNEMMKVQNPETDK